MLGIGGYRPLRKAGAPVLGTYSHPGLVIDKYIATGGNDTTGDGSIGNPWATLGKAFTDGTFPNNGWLAVRGGTYNQQNNLTKTGKVVNIVNYPGEAVTFHGQDTATRLLTLAAGTAGSSVRGIEVRNYLGNISGAGTNERAPLALNEGGTVEFCHFSNNAFNNLRCLMSSISATVTIRHCSFVGSGREAISVGGNGGIWGSLRMEYCEIHGNCLTESLTDFDVTAAGIKYVNILHADILHNHIWDNDGRGIWADVQCLDGLIYGNWCHDNRGTPPNLTSGDGIFYEISGDGYILNNFCSDNTRSGVMVSSGHRVYVMHNALLRNRTGLWNRDANRGSFVFGSPAERYQHPSDVYYQNNVIGSFLSGGGAAGNAFFRHENASPSSHNFGDVASGADPYGPITVSYNHYWQPVANTPADISRFDLAAGGATTHATLGAHQSAGYDADGSHSSVAANPFSRHELVGDLRLPVGHTQQLQGVALPEVVAERIGKLARAYSPGLIEPLAIY